MMIVLGGVSAAFPLQAEQPEHKLDYYGPAWASLQNQMVTPDESGEQDGRLPDDTADAGPEHAALPFIEDFEGDPGISSAPSIVEAPESAQPSQPQTIAHDPDKRRVRVVSPTFLPDPEAAIDLQVPARSKLR